MFSSEILAQDYMFNFVIFATQLNIIHHEFTN